MTELDYSYDVRVATEQLSSSQVPMEAATGRYLIGRTQRGAPLKVTLKIKNTFIECLSSDSEDEEEDMLPVQKAKSCPLGCAELPGDSPLRSRMLRAFAEVSEEMQPMLQEESESGLAPGADVLFDSFLQLPEHVTRRRKDLEELDARLPPPQPMRRLSAIMSKPKLPTAAPQWADMVDEAPEAGREANRARKDRGPGEGLARQKRRPQQQPAVESIPIPRFGKKAASVGDALPKMEAITTGTSSEEEDMQTAALEASTQAVALDMREPSDSLGSAAHDAGLCKPCGWYWRGVGCINGAACQHCHKCPRGTLKDRRRKKLEELRAEKKQRSGAQLP